jgi:hypothetical protein
MSFFKLAGKGSEDGRMTKRSQWIFFARREGTEMLVGRIIQRITFEMMRGLIEVEWRVERKFWREVEGVREMRLMVQTGILVIGLYLEYKRIGCVEMKRGFKLIM